MLKRVGNSGGVGVLGRALLLLRVHADAFRYDPLVYLQAVGWRLRRLRVRSRNAIAPLAGRSPVAYAYWMASHEAPLMQQAVACARGIRSRPAIIPVIDCRDGSGGLEATLASLPPESRPVTVGTAAADGVRSIAAPAELASLIPQEGGWICPMRCGDCLSEEAFAIYSAAAAAMPDAKLIYGDDDLIGPAGHRHGPHLKPDWNPELFEWHDFITNACIVAVTQHELAGLPSRGWAEALVRAAVTRNRPPRHVHHILHHRRQRPDPVVPGLAKARPVGNAPTVTAIVPTRDRVELLRNCVEGLERTDYAGLDVIVVDNESKDRETLDYLDALRDEGITVLRAEGPFNYSALNNLAVEHARGELLCFLNNDVEMIHPDWLSILVRQAVKADIGAVGARLLYPDGTLQHAGVVTGIGGGAAHAHRHQRQDEPGYFQRSRLPQRVSAVTGACLLVSKDKFEAVAGFDEEQFAVAFNDVDLCLKLNSQGWQSFYEPRATLIHHESKSRGSDRLKHNRTRFAGELAALKRKWGTDSKTDPYHHPQLSPFSEQFVISV